MNPPDLAAAVRASLASRDPAPFDAADFSTALLADG